MTEVGGRWSYCDTSTKSLGLRVRQGGGGLEKNPNLRDFLLGSHTPRYTVFPIVGKLHSYSRNLYLCFIVSTLCLRLEGGTIQQPFKSC